MLLHFFSFWYYPHVFYEENTMKRLLLLGAMLALSCKPSPAPQPPPKKLVDLPNPQSQKQTDAPPIVDNTPKVATDISWPERPSQVFGEFRVEGVLPTVQAILNQARKVSPSVPPLEGMVGVGIGTLLGLSDMTAVNTALAAGGLLVDVPGEPVPVLYLGVSSEDAFRKALPADAIKGDAKGNALVFMPPASSKLGSKEIYINFVGSYVVGSPSPDAFALVKSHLEAVVAKPLGSPTVWVAVEVSTLLKRFSAEIETGLTTMSTTMPPTPGVDMIAMFKGMIGLLQNVDEVELRHTPSSESYHLSFYVKPTAGSSFEARLKKPMPTLVGLEKKIPTGWMSGTMFMDPESLKESMSMVEMMMPQMKSLNALSAEVLNSLTGEMAMAASGDSKFGFVVIYGAKDENAVRDSYRKTYATEQKITMGTNEIKYSAMVPDAEKIGGVSVDKLEVDNGAVPSNPVAASMGLSKQVMRYAYLPGLVIMNIGDSTTAFEAILKGEAGSFESSPDVKVAFAELPAERLGAIFWSLPQMMKGFSSVIPIPMFSDMPDIKSGAAFGWWVEGDKLRFETIVPISHITDMINFFMAMDKKKSAPVSSPPMP
jgi:hypothetical protein